MERTYELRRIIEERHRSDKRWLEFLRVASLSMGVYVLPVGGEDPQQPHTEDEVYYVVGGRCTLRVGEVDHEVRPSSLLYVPARAEHRFHAIEEELTVLVFFAPAEGSRAAGAGSAGPPEKP